MDYDSDTNLLDDGGERNLTGFLAPPPLISAGVGSPAPAASFGSPAPAANFVSPAPAANFVSASKIRTKIICPHDSKRPDACKLCWLSRQGQGPTAFGIYCKHGINKYTGQCESPECNVTRDYTTRQVFTHRGDEAQPPFREGVIPRDAEMFEPPIPIIPEPQLQFQPNQNPIKMDGDGMDGGRKKYRNSAKKSSKKSKKKSSRKARKSSRKSSRK